MIDPKVEKPVDPKDEETAKKFLFGPEVKQTPSTSSEGRSRRSVDPLDKALAGWPGSVNIPRFNEGPRLVKRNFKHQSQAGPRP